MTAARGQNGPMRVAAVILAAGSSTRFGSPKQLARIGDVTMLVAVCEVARAAGLEPVIAVVPRWLAVPPDVVPVINDAPEDGLSRSLRLGLATVPDEATAALILLGDQPTVPAAVIADILHARGERPIVAASAAGLLGPPVLLERNAFGMAEAMTGDEGLRSLIRGNPHLVTPVEVGEHAVDVDTLADLGRLA